MWMAVFRTGRHTDSHGNEREWTEGDLDRIAAGYDPAKHEAPVVIGHPKENGPAFGWVEKLERVGDTLWAEIKPTVEGFSDWVKSGLWKKRSISLYPDMTLRHIGFLGAMPPAVKGLPDFKFEEKEDAMSIEFDEEDEKREGREKARQEHEARARKHGIGVKESGNHTKPDQYEHIPDDEFADPVNYKYPIDRAHIHAAIAYFSKAHNREAGGYSDEEQKKIWGRIKAAAKKYGVEINPKDHPFSERRQGMLQRLKDFIFAEEKREEEEEDDSKEEKEKKRKKKEDEEREEEHKKRERELDERERKLKEKEKGRKKAEAREYVESLKKKGILTPAMEKAGMGITAFMEALSEAPGSYDFAEADEHGKKAKQTPYEFMADFLSRLPKQVEFAEKARREDDDQDEGDDEAKREKAIRRHMKDNNMENDKGGKNYKKAMLEVSKKRPDLFERERR